MDGLGKPLQLDGLFVGSSHSTPCFIRQQYLSGGVPQTNCAGMFKNGLCTRSQMRPRADCAAGSGRCARPGAHRPVHCPARAGPAPCAKLESVKKSRGMSHHSFRLYGKTPGSLKKTASRVRSKCGMLEAERTGGLGPFGSVPAPRQAFTHAAGTPDSYQCSGWVLLKSASSR